MVKPINGYVIIELIPKPKRSVTLLYEVKADEYEEDKAKIVSVSDPEWEFKKGQKIAFAKFTEIETEELPEDQRLLARGNILAVLG